MRNSKIFFSVIFGLTLSFYGCSSIPQSSVTLSQELAVGITHIHESNIRFVNQYFNQKKIEIEGYEKKAIDDFFDKIIVGTSNPDAPQLDADDFHKIKLKIEEIHNLSNDYKAGLDASKILIIDKLQNDYNSLISINSAITGLLQSSVDVGKAKNDGLSKVEEFTKGKINLTEVESIVDKYISKIGTSSADASELFESIETLLNHSKGDK